MRHFAWGFILISFLSYTRASEPSYSEEDPNHSFYQLDPIFALQTYFKALVKHKKKNPLYKFLSGEKVEGIEITNGHIFFFKTLFSYFALQNIQLNLPEDHFPKYSSSHAFKSLPKSIQKILLDKECLKLYMPPPPPFPYEDLQTIPDSIYLFIGEEEQPPDYEELSFSFETSLPLLELDIQEDIVERDKEEETLYDQYGPPPPLRIIRRTFPS